VAACAAPMPDSNPNTGVGFSDYDFYATERARREAELQAMRPRAVPEGQVLASETMTALAATRTTVGGTAPVSAGVASPDAVQVTAIETDPLPNNPGISDEQSFDAVASRETIASDAERIQANRQVRQEVVPTTLPERGSGRPNVVAYALATSHPLGSKVYRRDGTSTTRQFTRECGKYASSDLAQEAFLSMGGPQRDRRGMDPDGDGYACFWDPSPYRAARGG
jgi:hypothetical protein